jgi:hypothetical protein
MNDNYLSGFPCRLVSGTFLLFLLSFYVPISPKPVFYAGLMLPGLFWLLWRPAALPAYFKAFGLLLLPLAIIQLLNIQEVSELKLWLYLAVFLACCLIVERCEGGSERIYRQFAWFSLFALGYATVEWLWIWHQTDHWVRYKHLFGREMDPNNTSILITSGLVFIWLTIAEPRLQAHSRWSLLAGMILLSCAVLLSAAIFQSRSTLVGFGLFMGVYVFMRRWWGLGLLAVMVVALVAYLAGADQMLSQRGMSFRPQIWDDAWHRVVDTCGILLGCGKDGYRFLGKFTHTHNLPMGIFYNDGVIGLVLMGIFAFVYVRGGIKLKSPWFLLSMIGFGSLMTNTGWLLAPPKAFWAYFWVPVLLAFIQVRREHVNEYIVARS